MGLPFTKYLGNFSGILSVTEAPAEMPRSIVASTGSEVMADIMSRNLSTSRSDDPLTKALMPPLNLATKVKSTKQQPLSHHQKRTHQSNHSHSVLLFDPVSD